MKPITHYQLLRTHRSNANYFLITQSILTIFDSKNGVRYNPSTKKIDILQGYEIKDKTDNTKQAEEQLLKYLKTYALSNRNVTIKDYKYFRVVLADGRDIICSNYDDFITQYFQLE